LTDFRNYAGLELDLEPGVTLLLGSNGQGKTNLVEALGFLTTLGSHRVSSDQPLIRYGRPAAIIRVQLASGERTVLAEVEINREGSNRAQINRSPIKMRDLPRSFASVLFAPEDLSLIRGEPAGRRLFLDHLLGLRNPRMLAVLADYDRVLRQRNSLLKTARTSRTASSQLGTLDIWDARLIEFGAQIITARAELVQEILPFVARAYGTVAGAEHEVRLTAALSIHATKEATGTIVADGAAGGIADDFATAIKTNRRAELERGITLIGPHRDDLVVTLNNLPARGYASHGESWSLALALKLASAELLRVNSPLGDPVLILDDVFAELDNSRRGRLSTAIAGFEQVLITAAVIGDVPESLRGRVIRIRNGEIVGDDE